MKLSRFGLLTLLAISQIAIPVHAAALDHRVRVALAEFKAAQESGGTVKVQAGVVMCYVEAFGQLGRQGREALEHCGAMDIAAVILDEGAVLVLGILPSEYHTWGNVSKRLSFGYSRLGLSEAEMTVAATRLYYATDREFGKLWGDR